MRLLIIFFLAFGISFSSLSAAGAKGSGEDITFKTERSTKTSRLPAASTRTYGKCRWTEETENALEKYVAKNGANKWKDFADTHGFTTKQCREHYGAVLSRKVEWTSQLEAEFWKQYAIYGNQWVKISDAIRSATKSKKSPDGILCPENMLKNKYYASLRRSLRNTDASSYPSASNLSHAVAPAPLKHIRNHLKRKASSIEDNASEEKGSDVASSIDDRELRGVIEVPPSLLYL